MRAVMGTTEFNNDGLTLTHLRSKEPHVAQLTGLLVAGLQLGSDYIDAEAEINCESINTHVIMMHDLYFAIKTTQMESVLLSFPSYKLKNVGLR